MISIAPRLNTFYFYHFQKLYNFSFGILIDSLNNAQDNMKDYGPTSIWYYWMCRYFEYGYGDNLVDSGVSILFALKYLKLHPNASGRLHEQCMNCVSKNLQSMLNFFNQWKQRKGEMHNDMQYTLSWRRVTDSLGMSSPSFEAADDELCKLITNHDDKLAYFLHTVLLCVLDAEWNGSWRAAVKLGFNDIPTISTHIHSIIRSNLGILSERFNFQIAKNMLGVLMHYNLFSFQANNFGNDNATSMIFKYFTQVNEYPLYNDSTYNYTLMMLQQRAILVDEAMSLLSLGYKEKHEAAIRKLEKLQEKRTNVLNQNEILLQEEFESHIDICLCNGKSMKVSDHTLGKWMEMSKYSQQAAYITARYFIDKELETSNNVMNSRLNSLEKFHSKSSATVHDNATTTIMGLLHFAASDTKHQMALLDLCQIYSDSALDNVESSTYNTEFSTAGSERFGVHFTPKMTKLGLWRGVTQDETHPVILYRYLLFQLTRNNEINHSELGMNCEHNEMQIDVNKFKQLLKLSVDMGLELQPDDPVAMQASKRFEEKLFKKNIQLTAHRAKSSNKPARKVYQYIHHRKNLSKVNRAMLIQKCEPNVPSSTLDRTEVPTNNQANRLKSSRLDYLISTAVTHYEKEEFHEAFPIIQYLVSKYDVERLYFPLAFMYDNGFGVDKNHKIAIRFYKKAFRATDSRYAAHNLGVIYQHTIRDIEEAKAWYFKSIENWGYSNSYFNLAVLFKDEGDYVTARELYQKAAAQKHDGALNNLGTLLEEGKGGPVDIEGAFECYMLAAKMKNKYALKNASGYLLERGQIEKAIEFLEASASQGFDPAMKRLGDIYDSDEYGVKNVVLATQWYAKGAQANNPDCYFKLGYAHQTGRGIKRCLKKAAYYYRISIKMTDSSPAKHNLAIILSAERNYSEAAKLYESAIANGYTLSANNLARLYRYGNGVPECYQSALHFYRLGHKHGHADSTNGLGTMYEKGLGVPRDMKIAFNYYLEAAQSMYPYGLFNVGLCFENGSAVEKDIVIALKLYKLAAERGHDQSRLRAANLILTYRNESVSGNI